MAAATTDWLGDADDWGDDTNLDNSSNNRVDEDNGNANVGSSPGSSSPDTNTPPSPMGAVGGFPAAGRPENRNLNWESGEWRTGYRVPVTNV